MTLLVPEEYARRRKDEEHEAQKKRWLEQAANWAVTKLGDPVVEGDAPNSATFHDPEMLDDDDKPYGWQEYCKWDGCVELTSPDGDRLHVCDFDQFVARMEGLLKIARATMGAHWP